MNEKETGTKGWIDEAEAALTRTVEAFKTTWDGTRETRMSSLKAARDAARRLGEAIDQGIDVAKEAWGPFHPDQSNGDARTGVDPAAASLADTETMTWPNDVRAQDIPMTDLEESAQGHDLFRAPGEKPLLEQARDQAEASGWLPRDVAHDWQSQAIRQRILDRRHDLYEAMRRLEASAARASGQPDWVEKVEGALTTLAASLERHVAEIEASDGLFAEVVDRAPHLTPEVEALRKEHDDLRAACRAALAFTSRPDWGDPATLRHMVLGLLGLLTLHRQRGAELLFDTYNVDLAGGD